MSTARILALLALAATGGCAAPPTAPAGDPDFMSMSVAERRGEKIGAPVDVRYQFAGVVATGRPVALQVAVVPRIEGSALRIEFPATRGVALGGASPGAVFGKAAPASAYRHTVELTPAADAPDRIPVIVSMDVAGGRFFSVFSIPLRAQAAGAPIH